MAVVVLLAEVFFYIAKQMFLFTACVGEIWVFSFMRLYYPIRKILGWIYLVASEIGPPTYDTLEFVSSHLVAAEYYIRHAISGTFYVVLGLVYIILKFLLSNMYWICVKVLPPFVYLSVECLMDVGIHAVKVGFEIVEKVFHSGTFEPLYSRLPRVLEPGYIILMWFILLSVIILSLHCTRNFLFGGCHFLFWYVYTLAVTVFTAIYACVFMITSTLKRACVSACRGAKFVVLYSGFYVMLCLRNICTSILCVRYIYTSIVYRSAWIVRGVVAAKQKIVSTFRFIFPAPNGTHPGTGDSVREDVGSRDRNSHNNLNGNGRANYDDININTSGLCNICLERPKCVLFQPCRHFYLCNECNQRLPTRNCPVCRQRIRSYIVGYNV